MSSDLHYLSKTDAVAEFLRNQIISGALERGAPLRQEEIASRLGVSSTPVREAFRILQTEGFLEQRPHRGTFVAVIDPDRMRDAAELRGAIEELAVAHTLKAVSPGALSRLSENVATSGKLAAKPDIHAFRAAAAEFHALLIATSGSAVLTELSTALRGRTNPFVPLDARGIAEVQRSHGRILASLKARDARRLIREIRGHAHWNANRVPERSSPSRSRVNAPSRTKHARAPRANYRA